MTLPASGVVTFEDVATELDRSGTVVTLNDSDVLVLIGKNSGDNVVFPTDFYGKSSLITAGFGFNFTGGSGSYQTLRITASYNSTSYTIYEDNTTHSGSYNITIQMARTDSVLINGVVTSTTNAEVLVTVTVFNTANTSDILQTKNLDLTATGRGGI